MRNLHLLLTLPLLLLLLEVETSALALEGLGLGVLWQFGQSGMVGVQLAFDVLHELEVVVVEFGLPAFEQPVVAELPEIDVRPGKPLRIRESLVERLDLVDHLDLFSQLLDLLLKLVLATDQHLQLLHKNNPKIILDYSVLINYPTLKADCNA
jgi:hypothetical protein